VNQLADGALWSTYAGDSSLNSVSDITAGYVCYKATDYLLRKRVAEKKS
jgi:hypothetical protein